MTAVCLRREGDFAVVEIDNPPVNALSEAVRSGLLRALDGLAAMDLGAVLLTCAGRTFVAGGDMREFDAPPQPPLLADVLDAIEAGPVPWAAVLHGSVLGGGLELALACAWRLAAPGTRFALPEVTLGLIPGAGGTQRLPRLIGLQPAARMAATGGTVDAARMLALGGIDAVLEGMLLAAAKAWLTPRPARPRAVSARRVAKASLEALRAEVAAGSKGAAAPGEALAAVAWAAETGFAEGAARERARFAALKASDQSRALRHAFFAERAVMKPAALAGAAPREVGVVAIAGGGLMGAGIAVACLGAGLEVALVERDAVAAVAGRGRIEAILQRGVTRGRLDAAEAAAQLARLSVGADYAAAAAADLAIEAVFEDLAIKREAFARFGAVMRRDAVLATNTSYLDPAAIAEGVPGPERVLGLHFFSPAQVMKLVEVVRTPATAAEVLATGFALARRLGKVAVLAGVCDGFIGNRMLGAWRREADYLLADGCLPHEIDAALRGFGLPMGPYELQDLTGLQIAWANRRRQAGARDPGERYVPVADRLCAAGRLGQAAGRGWYRYADGSRSPQRDAEVERLVEAYSEEARIARQRFAAEEIVARVLAAMVNEGARIVEEGVAAGPEAVDVVQMLGYGFPRWRGGPMFWAQTAGLDAVRAAMARVSAQSPGSWRVARLLA